MDFFLFFTTTLRYFQFEWSNEANQTFSYLLEVI